MVSFLQSLFLFFTLHLMIFSLLLSKKPLNGTLKYITILLILLTLTLSFSFGIFAFPTEKYIRTFPSMFSLICTITVMLMIGAPRNFLLAMVILSPCFTLITSLYSNNFYPVGGDTARFVGFAERIIIDGKWLPGKYMEDPYYNNVINAEPAILAVLHIILGVDLLKVSSVLVFVLNFVFGLSVYNYVANFSKNRNIGLLGALLAYSVPSFSMLFLIPRAFARTFFALFTLILSIIIKKASGNRSLIILAILVSISGVMFHPTYFIAIIVFITCVALSKMILGESYKALELKGLLLNILVITLSYWTYSEIIGSIVYPAKNFLTSVLELVSELELRKPRSTYFAETTPPFLAYAWVFPLALSGALLFSEFTKYIKYRNKEVDISLPVAIGGLIVSFFAFLSIIVGLSLSPYLQVGLLLLSVSSSVSAYKILNKWKTERLFFILIICIFTLNTYSAILSPEYSPGLYSGLSPGSHTTAADWEVTKTIINILPQTYQLNFIMNGTIVSPSEANPPGEELWTTSVYYLVALNREDYYNYWICNHKNPKGFVYLYTYDTPDYLLMNQSLVYGGYKYIIGW